MSRRTSRINELIKQEVGQILQREVHLGDYLVTITEVDTASDLKNAEIKIAIMPYEKEKEVLEIIKNNIGHIQRILNKKLTMRFVPRLKFTIDKGAKSAAAVDVILSGIDTTEE